MHNCSQGVGMWTEYSWFAVKPPGLSPGSCKFMDENVSVPSHLTIQDVRGGGDSYTVVQCGARHDGNSALQVQCDTKSVRSAAEPAAEYCSGER